MNGDTPAASWGFKCFISLIAVKWWRRGQKYFSISSEFCEICENFDLYQITDEVTVTQSGWTNQTTAIQSKQEVTVCSAWGHVSGKHIFMKPSLTPDAGLQRLLVSNRSRGLTEIRGWHTDHLESSLNDEAIFTARCSRLIASCWYYFNYSSWAQADTAEHDNTGQPGARGQKHTDLTLQASRVWGRACLRWFGNTPDD